MPLALLSGDVELVYEPAAVLGDEDIAFRIHRDAVRLNEFSLKCTGASESR